MLLRPTVFHWLVSFTKFPVLYGCASTLMLVLLLGTSHTLPTKPEQSPPYEPLCEQLGQLPEHEPLVEEVGPASRKRAWPHQYEKPTPALARSIADARAVVLPPLE